MNTTNAFGRILRHLREDNDLTQEKLCDELETKGNGLLNKSTISRWENGTRTPEIEIIKDLEEILGTEHGKLLMAAGYPIGTNSTQSVSIKIDYDAAILRQEHRVNLTSIAKAILANGLDNVSSPGWTTNPSLQGKYLLPNETAASGFDEITKKQLTNHLNTNI